MEKLLGLESIAEEMIKIRKLIHKNPELGFQEHNTARLVSKKLQEWGYSIKTKVGQTGVIGQLVTGEGPSIGLRADMDALPILEENNFDHKSDIDGVMHACGHDGHTATLLATAKYLSQNPHFSGTLNLFFQPAEEGLAGAKAMIDDGALDEFPCDAIFGFHNMPGYPEGHFGFHQGAVMASSDRVTVKIKGKGGHGAMPHLSIDPIVVASSIIMNLQTITSRNINPINNTVISVGSINAGNTFNVIPNTVTLQLSVRNLDIKTQDLVENRIKELIHHQAKSYGASAEIEYFRSYPILYNAQHETEFAHQVAVDFLGEESIIPDFPAMMASEDFSFFANECPSSYIFVGNGLTGSHGCSVHNPEYDFNDALIPIVASYWTKLVYAFCPQ